MTTNTTIKIEGNTVAELLEAMTVVASGRAARAGVPGKFRVYTEAGRLVLEIFNLEPPTQ